MSARVAVFRGLWRVDWLVGAGLIVLVSRADESSGGTASEADLQRPREVVFFDDAVEQKAF
jgi:hypothetical protein